MPLPMTRIILYVQDVALLKAFYQRYFDLPVIEEIENEWVLGAGAIELALHLAGGVPPRSDGSHGSARGNQPREAVFSIRTSACIATGWPAAA